VKPSFHEELAERQRRERYLRTAHSYMEEAERLLSAEWGRGGLPQLSYEHLLRRALGLALAIVEAMPDSYFVPDEEFEVNNSDDAAERAGEVKAALDQQRKAHRLLRKLEGVTGRTDEEKELFRQKREQLRRRMEGDSR
jgi:hypothetical protein